MTELYTEIRKREEFFLYIIVAGITGGATCAALGISSLDDARVIVTDKLLMKPIGGAGEYTSHPLRCLCASVLEPQLSIGIGRLPLALHGVFWPDSQKVTVDPRNEESHPRIVMPARIQHALAETYGDVLRNHTLQMAAALSYYFVLSMFPSLILLSAIVAYLPVPNLFDQALAMMTRFLPPDSMGLVRRVLSDVITPSRGTFLSFGIVGTLWTASGGFAAAIEALNIAYDVEDDRPIWKTRSLAVGLALVIGALMLVALSVMIVGPRFGEWLAGRVHLSYVFVSLWPYIHWSIAIGFAILAVEALYFLAPNVKQRFLATLPGAILAVGCWLALSHLLGLYFRHFANFNKTYGTLGAGIALMTWLYWTGFAMLVGAELNSELAKISSEGKIEEKHEPPAITKIDFAA